MRWTLVRNLIDLPTLCGKTASSDLYTVCSGFSLTKLLSLTDGLAGAHVRAYIRAAKASGGKQNWVSDLTFNPLYTGRWRFIWLSKPHGPTCHLTRGVDSWKACGNLMPLSKLGQVEWDKDQPLRLLKKAVAIQNNMWRGQRVQQVTSTDQISVPNGREKCHFSALHLYIPCLHRNMFTLCGLRCGWRWRKFLHYNGVRGLGEGVEAKRPQLLFLFQVMWLENDGYASTPPFSRWKESLNVSLHRWLSTADRDSIFALCKSVQTFVQGD